jgi:hypothetical protein
MKRFLWSIAAAALVILPSVARTQTSPTFGAGPNGYDYMIGTWSCVNSMAPSAMGAPAQQTMTVSKGGGALFFHSTSEALDFTSYNVYVPSKKMWVSPVSGSDGTYGSESTAQSGKTVVWTGSAYQPPLGKMLPIRDTYTNEATRFVDLGETQIGGTWKAEYRLTCTKS